MAKINDNPVEVTPEATNNTELLDVVKQLQEEVNRLREKDDQREAESVNMFKKAKERYDWPRKYTYKMRWWVPVLGYKSTRKEPTKDFVYLDKFGNAIDNHLMELTLAVKLKTKDEYKKVLVEANEFGNNYTLSTPVPCNVVSDWSSITWYEFTTKDHWTFTVLPNIINN